MESAGQGGVGLLLRLPVFVVMDSAPYCLYLQNDGFEL